jgi:quercetin dioxygenase-like cupin family protein
MTVLSNGTLEPNVIPGLAHRTLAGAEHGLSQLSVWAQALDPNGATPPHRHDCEEVVVVLDGEGMLLLDGKEEHFRAGDTVIVPRNAPHQIIAGGDRPLRIVASFSMAPVHVEFPDGATIELPWQRG